MDKEGNYKSLAGSMHFDGDSHNIKRADLHSCNDYEVTIWVLFKNYKKVYILNSEK